MNKVVIVGYGGHAKSVADSIKTAGQYEIAGYMDMEDKHVFDLPFLGTDEDLPLIYQNGIRYAVCGLGYVGKSSLRDSIYEYLKAVGYILPVIIDPSAVVAQDVAIGEGTYIGKKAVVNANSNVGKMCIINTGAIVEHGNAIGDFSHVATGTVLCGDISIGEHCLIGANATILQGLSIGNNTIIGGGSIVLGNVESNVTRLGKIKGDGKALYMKH